MLGTATAAAVLAELHGVKSEREIEMDGVSLPRLRLPGAVAIHRITPALVPRGISIAYSIHLSSHHFNNSTTARPLNTFWPLQ